MIFGKIDYINLLPFYVFLKRYVKSSRMKKAIDYKKSYPSAINRQFKQRKIDAAFISSVESKRCRCQCLNVGIVAQKEIQSVLVKKGKVKPDPHSATSNKLAKILNIEGEVVIGDRALKLYLENPHSYIDLARKWHEKTSLPFVFARLCVNQKEKKYARMAKKFTRTRVKIPRYILKKYSHQRGIKENEILNYINLVTYKIDKQAERSLKLFFQNV